MMAHYLKFPSRVLDELEQLLCDDMEQLFASQVEAHLQFMRKRGVGDPYRFEQLRADYVQGHVGAQQQLLDKYLAVIPPALRERGVTVGEFAQCWALMGGIWNSVDFDRLRPIVRLQQQYPVLLDVARRVGRIADDQGPERVPVSAGGSMRVEHSAPSDIEGITVGNDLSALLPVELAILSDPTLDSLFAYRFASQRLQTFQYKSSLMKRSHRLEVRRARQRGPMIVCLDTSGSMQGTPARIAASLLLRLLQLSLQQDRDLMLIAFSTSAHCIDVRQERTRLLDFLRREGGGDTDGTQMLRSAFDLISSDGRYGSADLLLISDFKFPLVTEPLLRRLQQLHDEGTRLYALQLGNAPSIEPWKPHLDAYWRLDYKLRRKPWFIEK